MSTLSIVISFLTYSVYLVLGCRCIVLALLLCLRGVHRAFRYFGTSIVVLLIISINVEINPAFLLFLKNIPFSWIYFFNKFSISLLILIVSISIGAGISTRASFSSLIVSPPLLLTYEIISSIKPDILSLFCFLISSIVTIG